jgi:hypothetical protein
VELDQSNRACGSNDNYTTALITYQVQMTSVMLQTPSRASTASSSSFQPVSRQNTMSSHDGGRSVRQSKRYSMTTLYLSMSANEKDLEIEDDLAKGKVIELSL